MFVLKCYVTDGYYCEIKEFSGDTQEIVEKNFADALAAGKIISDNKTKISRVEVWQRLKKGVPSVKMTWEE